MGTTTVGCDDAAGRCRFPQVVEDVEVVKVIKATSSPLLDRLDDLDTLDDLCRSPPY